MEKIIDLHIHSNYSDGSLSPKEIIDEAVKNNISVISIADHDTVEAYNEETTNYANKKNIKLISGVEISSKIGNLGMHILGYNFDISNKKMKEKLKLLRNARHDYLFNVCKKLNELGYIVNINELDKIEAVTKAHIAIDIITNKNNFDLLMNSFGHIPDKGEFIETVMNEGCPAFVKKESITPMEAANLIKEAGGKVVLAHPVAYKFEDNLDIIEIQKLINEIKPDGIESYYIYIDKHNNKIDEIKKWTEFTQKNSLFFTVGSDFHTKDGIHPEIGLKNENIELTDELINNILNNLAN